MKSCHVAGRGGGNFWQTAVLRRWSGFGGILQAQYGYCTVLVISWCIRNRVLLTI